MPGAYGFVNWVERHAGALVVAGAATGVIAAILTPKILKKTKASAARRGGLADRGFADTGFADQGCVRCGDRPFGNYRGDRARQGLMREVYASKPAFAGPAAYQNMRDQGYVGYSYGPLGRYPGAKGPAPAVPVYGSYRGASRMGLHAENGPSPGWKTGIQSISTRQNPVQGRYPVAEVDFDAGAHNQYPDDGLGPGIDADQFARTGPGANRANRARQGTADAPETPVGVFPNSYYRWKVSMANQIGLQTEDYPSGEVGYNLSVGNLPSAAEGNLSAPVTYQQVTPRGGVGEPTPQNAQRPLLGMGGGGYRARIALWNEQGPAYSHIRAQAIANAQEARAQAERGFADETQFADEGDDIIGFQWWKPHAETGPLGNARFSLSDDGGGYVSPTAYRGFADRTLVVPQGGYAPLHESGSVPGYDEVTEDSSLENTIDIQTQDYPGGEIGYNLSVNNLPLAADGNLSAPVVRQQLAPAGGIAGWDEPNLPRLRPWLDQSRTG